MLIFGVGPGVVLIAVIWCMNILACVVLHRTKGFPSVIAINVTAIALTLLILAWPLRDAVPKELLGSSTAADQRAVFDRVFVPRLALAFALLAFVLAMGFRFIRLAFQPTFATRHHSFRSELVSSSPSE